MNAGDTLKPFRIARVSPEGMKAWAKFLHDPNPIHLDPAVVKAKGLGERVINQGPANLAYLINMLQAANPWRCAMSTMSSETRRSRPEARSATSLPAPRSAGSPAMCGCAPRHGRCSPEP
jgi:hypothetical protein